MVQKYTSFLHDMGDESISAILINGRGGDLTEWESENGMPHNSHISKRSKSSPKSDSPTPELPRSEFMVERGKSYRFRVINAGLQYCPLEFSIDDHNLTVIATDGNPIQRIDVASFFILPGERVDFVLNAYQEIDTYWIKVKGNADCEDDQVFQTAILKYKTATSEMPENETNYENAGPNQKGKVKY